MTDVMGILGEHRASAIASASQAELNLLNHKLIYSTDWYFGIHLEELTNQISTWHPIQLYWKPVQVGIETHELEHEAAGEAES